MTKRKFYRTVVQIEILSEDPYKETDLGEIMYDITEGHCSGEAKDVVRNEEKNGKEMAALLKAQRSDPEFFMLDEEGNDTEDALDECSDCSHGPENCKGCLD